MAIQKTEGNHTFSFTSHHCVIKVDELEAYTAYSGDLDTLAQKLRRSGSSSIVGNKDMDFVAVKKPNTVQLIEVKDFTKNIQNNLFRFNESTESNSDKKKQQKYLPTEVAGKAIDTLLALNFAFKTIDTNDIRVLKAAYAKYISDPEEEIQIVLWLFYNQKTVDGRRVHGQLHMLRDKLRKNLLAIGPSTKVLVNAGHNDDLIKVYDISTSSI